MSEYKAGPIDDCTCVCGVLERVRFFPQQLVTSEDLNDQVEYVLNKLRRHNRYLHGFGIVCGLEVTPPDAEQDETGYYINVAPGYALSPFGDEVYVDKPFNWDLTDAIFGNPDDCQRSTPVEGAVYFAAIRPVDCYSRPVRVRADSCACDESTCEFSRVRESFEYRLLSELPQSYKERNMKLELYRKGYKNPPCLPCPTDNWIVIAVLRYGLQRIELVQAEGLILTATTLEMQPVTEP